jgi:hypothetical protein
MLSPTQLLLLPVTIVITTGITPVQNLQIIPVGPHQKAVSQSTTHVQQVGVSLMVAKTEFGQRLLVQVYTSITPTIALTKA